RVDDQVQQLLDFSLEFMGFGPGGHLSKYLRFLRKNEFTDLSSKKKRPSSLLKNCDRSRDYNARFYRNPSYCKRLQKTLRIRLI
ncbi:MAG: hypothetical protein U9N19_07795, partial [Thermodesulfobacteriota bacterium]|nr:hypothetical protein [Thermodesulfobacteriota bacterium]